MANEKVSSIPFKPRHGTKTEQIIMRRRQLRRFDPTFNPAERLAEFLEQRAGHAEDK